MKIQIQITKSQFDQPLSYICTEAIEDTQSRNLHNQDELIDIEIDIIIPSLQEKLLANLNGYLNSNYQHSKPANFLDVANQVLKNTFDAAKTAKPIVAFKYVTAKPSFWKTKGYGDREKPLSNNELLSAFLTTKDIQGAEQHPKIKNLKSSSTRERLFNKILETHIKDKGYKQVIILGSGFDIRPLKKNSTNQLGKKHAAVYSQVKFWEIDKKEILDEKESILKFNKLDQNASYIRADYVQENFIEKLNASGIQFDLPTLIIWEGNTMYLEKNQVIKVVNRIKYSFNHFTLAFDYFTQSYIENEVPKTPLKGIWKTGFNDIKQFAIEEGLTIVSEGKFGDLEIEYGVDTNPSEDVQQYSYCTLQG